MSFPIHRAACQQALIRDGNLQFRLRLACEYCKRHDLSASQKHKLGELSARTPDNMENECLGQTSIAPAIRTSLLCGTHAPPCSVDQQALNQTLDHSDGEFRLRSWAHPSPPESRCLVVESFCQLSYKVWLSLLLLSGSSTEQECGCRASMSHLCKRIYKVVLKWPGKVSSGIRDRNRNLLLQD